MNPIRWYQKWYIERRNRRAARGEVRHGVILGALFMLTSMILAESGCAWN
jgi:hypothetical protein